MQNPPPIVAFLTAAMMWGIAKVAPAVEIGAGLRFALVALLATIGGIFAFSGFQAFGQAKTTISPINIEEASALVTTGIYRTTRNPMYLGLLMLLLAFAAYLAVPLALLGRPARLRALHHQVSNHPRRARAFSEIRRRLSRLSGARSKKRLFSDATAKIDAGEQSQRWLQPRPTGPAYPPQQPEMPNAAPTTSKRVSSLGDLEVAFRQLRKTGHPMKGSRHEAQNERL